MNLIPWKKKHDLPIRREFPASSIVSGFRSEMDRLFDRFFHDPWHWSEEMLAPLGAVWPTIDVSEDDKAITIRAEVPGLESDDVNITVSGNILTISGEKSESKEDTGADHYHCERRFGSFRRSVELPMTADPDHVEAEERNGVLTIRVAKTPTTPVRHIEVRPGVPEGRKVATRST